jgi:hypothetical protein
MKFVPLTMEDPATWAALRSEVAKTAFYLVGKERDCTFRSGLDKWCYMAAASRLDVVNPYVRLAPWDTFGGKVLSLAARMRGLRVRKWETLAAGDVVVWTHSLGIVVTVQQNGTAQVVRFYGTPYVVELDRADPVFKGVYRSIRGSRP